MLLCATLVFSSFSKEECPEKKRVNFYTQRLSVNQSVCKTTTFSPHPPTYFFFGIFPDIGHSMEYNQDLCLAITYLHTYILTYKGVSVKRKV